MFFVNCVLIYKTDLRLISVDWCIPVFSNFSHKEEFNEKGLKYEYEVNTNVLIGKLNVIQIRTNISFERKENKYTQMVNKTNKKRAL